MEVIFSKPKKRKKKKMIIIVIIIIFILCSFIFIQNNVNPEIIAASEKEAQSLTNYSIAKSINEIISQNISYQDLVNILYDNDGKIQAILANSTRINLISQMISIKTYEYISNLGLDGIDISLGSLTGMPIFTEKGPFMNFKIKPISSVKCDIKSNFISAGINQTLHQINAIVVAEVTVIIPGLKDRVVNTETSVLLTESIIIGEVPQVYFTFNNMDQKLNLVP